MSLTALGTSAAALATSGDEGGHFPPKSDDFWQPLITFGHMDMFGKTQTLAITRPMVVMTVVVIALCTWLLLTTRKATVVPGKGQWFTEQVYGFARNSIGEDMIGSKHFMKYVPLLFSMFVFILLNNWMGIIPPFQNPPMARIAFPIALTLIIYFVYHAIGFKKHGAAGYIKWMLPPGLPFWIAPFILLLELITFFITRPLTLALRLFGNMFAGHMLLVVFIVGGYELLLNDSVALKFAAIPAWIVALVMTVFEALVQFLQAYVFTLLAASYIGGALADDH
ncbi:F0F1 ATP synthase subunit A [Luteipulveratus halotolerans]|uniref:ATP synthase subunit a n=1 Tax=Luteipulveratus halotolerans TaxID=1631356 RepID=A0A0L6CFY6_9MICO|nr:F0F1 ATP synthase subunit A [Luteipulveratus halotolerans]KNX36619.1 ATP synthase subunit A [Luteipulveratus halotolerans]